MHHFLSRIAFMLVAALAIIPQTALAQRAGDLIAARPVDGAPAHMRAWRIEYWSSDDSNQLIRVTGMVIAPRIRPVASQRRVIAWNHGLIGMAQRCGPSLGMDNFATIPALDDVIRRGYTVVAADYPGLGSDMVHPVLVGTAEGKSVLDAVRAHRSIPEADAGTRFALWGESQGGHAALWAGQLWPVYAPDLQLVGIAAMVPPTDLARNFRESADRRVAALLTSYTATSWSRYYGAPMATFGSRSTQNVMTRLADNNCIQFGAKLRIGTILGVLTVQRALRNIDVSTIEPWSGLMRDNNPSPSALAAPALIMTGTADTIVSGAVALDFARQACALGKTMQYLSITGGDHASVARTEAPVTLDWIDARFAGQPAPDNCRSI